MTQFRSPQPPRPENYGNNPLAFMRAMSDWATQLAAALDKHSKETDLPTKETYNLTSYTLTTAANFGTMTGDIATVANVLGSLIMTSLNAKGITRQKVTTQ